VLSGPNKALLAAMGSLVDFVADPDDAPAALAAAQARGPRSPDELMQVLRILFRRHATPVMLAALTRHLGGGHDPLAARQAAAVVRLERTDPAPVVESIIDQEHRPAEALIYLRDAASWPAGATGALEAAGVETRVFPGERPATWAEIADVARSEWLTLWPTDGRARAAWLLDLMLGGETGRADAVGYSGGEPLRHVSSLELDSAAVRRAVARRLLAERTVGDDDVRLDGWERRGLTLLSVGPARS
jgi:hypothetical protein